MRVGFLSNQLDNRGTGNAMFDYARYNQEILNNESYIYTFMGGQHHPVSVQRYTERFRKVHYVRPDDLPFHTRGLDVLYHIKYGNEDGIRPNPDTVYAVHSVFTNTPHGDRYATISRWLSSVGPYGGLTPSVPHIIDLPDLHDDLRAELGIPKRAVVFGRYGGYDTFDISWVWDVIEKILTTQKNVWFLFANTQPFVNHPRVIYYPEITSPNVKSIFINTCNYMLHARHRGETFGIAVGEFASKGRTIITYANSGERAHIEELGGAAKLYSDQFDLYQILTDARFWYEGEVAYADLKPPYVMKKFKEVFLEP